MTHPSKIRRTTGDVWSPDRKFWFCGNCGSTLITKRNRPKQYVIRKWGKPKTWRRNQSKFEFRCKHCLESPTWLSKNNYSKHIQDKYGNERMVR
jgi:hypothetical protein